MAYHVHNVKLISHLSQQEMKVKVKVNVMVVALLQANNRDYLRLVSILKRAIMVMSSGDGDGCI